MKRVLAIAAVLMMPSGILAQSVDAARPNSVADMLRGMGYTARIETDSYGDPVIRSAASGVDFTVYFYGCENGAACLDVQFVAAFDLTDPISAEAVNSWNFQTVMGRASIDGEGDPYLELYVPGVIGTTPDSFAHTIGLWDQTQSDFLGFIDW